MKKKLKCFLFIYIIHKVTMFSSLFKINYCVNHIAINDSISVDLVFCGNWCGAKFDKMVVNYNEHAFEFRQDDYCSGVTIYIKSIAMITDYFKVHNVRLTTKQIIDDVINMGAYGAKLLGSGGCGFILVVSDPIVKQKIIEKYNDFILNIKFNNTEISENLFN